MKKCPSCSEQLKGDATECSHCGKSSKRDQEALRALYDFKAELSLDFIEKNKRNLGSLEAEMMRECARKL